MVARCAWLLCLMNMLTQGVVGVQVVGVRVVYVNGLAASARATANLDRTTTSSRVMIIR